MALLRVPEATTRLAMLRLQTKTVKRVLGGAKQRMRTVVMRMMAPELPTQAAGALMMVVEIAATGAQNRMRLEVTARGTKLAEPARAEMIQEAMTRGALI